MRNKYVFVTVLLLALAFLGFGFTRGYVKMEEHEDREELLVVTSFYPMYVAALNVAADCPNVRVENLSEPQTGCLHDYQLTPQDMILLSSADVFVVNGGGIEGFLAEVADAYPELVIINAGAEIFEESWEDHGEEKQEGHSHEEHDHGENAHAWMSIPHYRQQIDVIRRELSAINPANKELYEQNAAKYLEQIDQLWKEAKELAVGLAGEHVVVLHEAFEFVAEDYGMQVSGELNLDEERQVSAGEIADILAVIQEKHIRIILAEDLYGRDMGDIIERETGCETCYLDTLTRGDGAKDSWLVGMRNNIEILKEAFEGN